VTSFRQIEANRRNAARSTGPVTEAGKQRSRRNAVRHGLCAETVVGVLEDAEDYKGFESAIIADFNAETTVERELVLRLASLLWRIRRATAIETALFQIQAEILQERRLDRSPSYPRLGVIQARCADIEEATDNGNASCGHKADQRPAPTTTDEPDTPRDLAHCFQRLVNLDGATFEQLGRYERALSRQITQTLFLLRPQSRRRRAGYWQEHDTQNP
jgi:hypothetical protein